MILKRAAEFRKMEVRGTLTVRAIAIRGVLELAGELQRSTSSGRLCYGESTRAALTALPDQMFMLCSR